MKLGAVLPFTTIGDDAGALLAFVQGVERLGYHQILVYDHVIGANPASRPGWNMPYINTTPFYEPFTLFGFMAAASQRLELVSAVIILSQRQTVLVAKQAATADILSKGRVRLGVGTGWNEVEYEALGFDFERRGPFLDEQIDLLRRLWAEQALTFDGKWHRVTDAGIAPLPPARSIPIWIGGAAPPAIRRAIRTGDGWLPYGPQAQIVELMDSFWSDWDASGRERQGFAVEAIVFAHPDDHRPDFGHAPGRLDDALKAAEVWRDNGATHVAFHTMATDAADVDAHLRFLEAARDGLSWDDLEP